MTRAHYLRSIALGLALGAVAVLAVRPVCAVLVVVDAGLRAWGVAS